MMDARTVIAEYKKFSLDILREIRNVLEAYAEDVLRQKKLGQQLSPVVIEVFEVFNLLTLVKKMVDTKPENIALNKTMIDAVLWKANNCIDSYNAIGEAGLLRSLPSSCMGSRLASAEVVIKNKIEACRTLFGFTEEHILVLRDGYATIFKKMKEMMDQSLDEMAMRVGLQNNLKRDVAKIEELMDVIEVYVNEKKITPGLEDEKSIFMYKLNLQSMWETVISAQGSQVVTSSAEKVSIEYKKLLEWLQSHKKFHDIYLLTITNESRILTKENGMIKSYDELTEDDIAKSTLPNMKPCREHHEKIVAYVSRVVAHRINSLLGGQPPMSTSSSSKPNGIFSPENATRIVAQSGFNSTTSVSVRTFS